MNKKILAEMVYVDRLLDVIQNKDEFTQSDLQGTLQAIIHNIARDEDLLTFDERLARSKSIDLL